MRRKIIILTVILFRAGFCLAECPSADLNGDCIVNFLDFRIMALDPDYIDLHVIASQWLESVADDAVGEPLRLMESVEAGSNDQGLFSLEFLVVGKKRVSRTVFEYECLVILENTSTETIRNIELTMADCPDNMEIIDAHVSFRYHQIPPGQSDSSIDTCTFRVHRCQLIDPSEIIWKIPNPPEEMVFIPGGTFEMGDNFGGDDISELPVHTVTLDSFYMDKYETTNRKYCDYLNSAKALSLITVSHGVVFQAGSGTEYPYCDTSTSSYSSQIGYDGGAFYVSRKSSRDRSYDPMVEVSWCGAVAYCNWRSQQEGKEECYNPATWNCDYSKDGYRLPTEAEWEYAARGGFSDRRFPWGNTISHSQANYRSNSSYSYDVSSTRGYHPIWSDDIYPYTSPVGSFAVNGYGLYDVTGNVWEWCNDWYANYYYNWGHRHNPAGPSRRTFRVFRGGSWLNYPVYCRLADRNFAVPLTLANGVGFRLVMPFHASHPSPVEYVSLDDMESYAQWTVPHSNIWDLWNDGIGDCAGSGNNTGSTLDSSVAPVLCGLRAMKVDYDNDGLVFDLCTWEEKPIPYLYSRIEAQVADLPSGIGPNWNLWTDTQLVISFYGRPENEVEEVDPLWIELTDGAQNSAKVVYGDHQGQDPQHLKEESWHEWFIGLADFVNDGLDTTNVATIAIGIGSEDATTPGCTGILYFDEIRLANFE